MPRYFFNVYNDDITMDDLGTELPDDEAARAHAVKAVRSLAADTVRHGHFVHHHYIEITDSDRNPIGRVRFDEAVDARA